MNNLIRRMLRPEMIGRAIAACLAAIVCVGWLAVRIERRVVESLTVTQAQVEEGWKAAGIEVAVHTIRQGENFWKVGRQYGVDIDTVHLW